MVNWNSHRTKLICLSPRLLPLLQPCLLCQGWESLGSWGPSLAIQESSKNILQGWLLSLSIAGVLQRSWNLLFSLVGYLGVEWSWRVGQKAQDLLIASATTSIWSHPGLWAHSSSSASWWTSHLNHMSLTPAASSQVAVPSCSLQLLDTSDWLPCGEEQPVRVSAGG